MGVEGRTRCNEMSCVLLQVSEEDQQIMDSLGGAPSTGKAL